MSRFCLSILMLSIISCGQPVERDGDEARLFDNNTKLTIFPVAEGWGYSIDVNGKKFIRQETVPVMPGSHPFATREQAEKVGSWVAARLRHNEAFSLTLPMLQGLMGTTDEAKN